jgi:hypothetical protein
MVSRVVGITGRKFNGKDTLGKYFIENMGYEKLAFADALKDACKCIFGFSDEQLYGDKKEEVDECWKVSPRKVLQFVGTELFRNQLSTIMPEIGNDIWVAVIKKKILDNPSKKFVITDVRFPNECELIKKLGGTIIRVNRSSVNTEVDVHASEIAIEKLEVDFQMENDGTIEELYEKFSKLLF